MKRAIGLLGKPRWFAVALLAFTLSACSYWEHASVTIKYVAAPPSDGWSLPSSGQYGVKDAFKQLSDSNGYKCRTNFKHPDGLLCRGPKDLHLSFRPALNKAEFVADFSWVNTSDRTHDEFARLVASFATQMAAIVGDQHVQLESDI
jgi:hypothetical protein